MVSAHNVDSCSAVIQVHTNVYYVGVNSVGSECHYPLPCSIAGSRWFVLWTGAFAGSLGHSHLKSSQVAVCKENSCLQSDMALYSSAAFPHNVTSSSTPVVLDQNQSQPNTTPSD